MSGPTVLKFGGTSVEDAAAFERAAEIVRGHAIGRRVVVVSAMSGVTDALLRISASDSRDGKSRRDDIERIIERHREVVRQLLEPPSSTLFEMELERAHHDLEELLRRLAQVPDERPALCDEIVSYGERLSAALLAGVIAARGLPACGIDARRCIVTDDTHGRARPLPAETERRTREELLPAIERGTIPVLGGFIGATRRGNTTTLGRGGGDYSAALIGAALDAAEIQIWTDVSGVLTADPRCVERACTIPRLSYAEAAELAYFGAKVLHPKTIQPAMDKRIPVRVCNSRAPGTPGTLITAEADVWPDTVKAIAHKGGITIVQVTAARMLGAYGFLRALFEVFERHRTVVDVVTTSEVSVSITLDDTAALPAIVEELRALGQVVVESGRAIVCVVGEGLRLTPGIAARVFHAVRDINVLLVSQGASRVNLTFVVDEAQAREAVRRLHAALIERIDNRLSHSA